MIHERRNKIIQLISRDGTVKVNELMAMFQVSIETIRRDLEYLESAGYLKRVYGGAVGKTMSGIEPEYASREVKHYAEKMLIGRKAVDHIDDGDTIIIDVGTTALEFAKALKGKKQVTIITNSLPIALTFANDPNIKVIVLGGSLRGGDDATSGYLAEINMRLFNVDKAIIGIGGITADKGITDYHLEEASLRRAFVESSKYLIGLADYSKFGVVAMNNICAAQNLDVLVTDAKADRKALNDLRDKGMIIDVAADYVK